LRLHIRAARPIVEQSLRAIQLHAKSRPSWRPPVKY
jgi:hypothetical protein